MYIGYIVNDTYPLLKTISFGEIKIYKGKLPILIPSQELAQSYDQDLDLTNKTIENDKVYWSFSAEETTKEKYYEYINNFVKNLLESIIRKYNITVVNSLSDIPDFNDGFCYETNNSITLTTGNIVYYLNKESCNYFKEECESKILNDKSLNVYAFSQFKSFQSLLKVNNQHLSEKQLIEILKPYFTTSQINLYLGMICYDVYKRLDKSNLTEIQIYNKEYEIEEWLSGLKIKIDLDFLEKELVKDEDNKTLNSIYDDAIQTGYIIQRYNGTDKVTGRIFPYNNSYSIQTLTRDLRQMIISEEGCSLVEIDYNHFEYSILSQLCDIEYCSDPHLQTAIKVFGDETKRKIGKEINYALLYGMNIDKLVNELSSTHSLNKEDLKHKLEQFTKPITELKLQLEKQFQEEGFIYNFFGKKIYPKSQHTCLNNYVQSTAATIFINKLIKVRDFLLENTSIKNFVVLQNHDSILLNIENSKLKSIIKELQEILETSEKKLKNTVEVKTGNNWSDVK